MNPLLIRRRGMMVAQQGGLPYDAEIEYLEGTGTQYIDTGIIPIYNLTGFEGEVEFVAYPQTDNYIFGCRQNGSNTRFWAGVVYSKLRGAIGNYSASTIDVSLNIKALMTFNINGNAKVTIGIDEFTMPVSSFSINRKAYLFCANNQGSAAFFVKAKIYNSKIYNGTSLVRDFIPVRVGTVGYMYDRVSGQLFGNAGTGDFILGPDIQ